MVGCSSSCRMLRKIMERLTSRKNPVAAHLRRLGTERAYRHSCGEFLGAGEKLLHEALRWDAEITAVLWGAEPLAELECKAQYLAPPALMEYVSPLKSAPSVVFSVRMRRWECRPGKILVLDTIQDPGNLGTILRTANAFGIETVVLTGDCADVWNPKTVRAGMGAVFRQPCVEMQPDALRAWLADHDMKLYGAALSEKSADIRSLDLRNAAVAIGSEGKGLSAQLLSMCSGELVIPMNPACESLNAAIAAAIVMWELSKREQGG